MCSTALNLQLPAMGTKQVIQAASRDICQSVPNKGEAERRRVRMSWIAVADANGNLRPQVRWRTI